MNSSDLRETLRHSGRRIRIVVVSAGVVIGVAGITLAYTEVKVHPGFQAAIIAVSASLLGTSLLSVINSFSLTTQISDLFTREAFQEALRETLETSSNVRDDATFLGIDRIFGRKDDVQRHRSLEELVEGAETIYILGTSLSLLAMTHTIIANNPGASVRYILVAPERSPETACINEALAVIHDIANAATMQAKLTAALGDLINLKQRHPTIEYKLLSFVTPFSAIMALGTRGNEEWGRLQIDHYLLRTTPESRLWILSSDTKSIIFRRYRQIIEDIWERPERYNVGELQTRDGRMSSSPA